MSSMPPRRSDFKPPGWNTLRFICTHCSVENRKFEYIYTGEILYTRGCYRCYYPFKEEDVVEWMARHRMRNHHPERLNDVK